MKHPQAWGAGGLTHQAAEEAVERGDTWLPFLVGAANVREGEKRISGGAAQKLRQHQIP